MIYDWATMTLMHYFLLLENFFFEAADKNRITIRNHFLEQAVKLEHIVHLRFCKLSHGEGMIQPNEMQIYCVFINDHPYVVEFPNGGSPSMKFIITMLQVP
jgi:hypothetical protein